MTATRNTTEKLKDFATYFLVWILVFALFALIRRYGTVEIVGSTPIERPDFSEIALLNIVVAFILAFLSVISDYVLSIRRTVHMSFGKIVGLGFLLNLGMLILVFLVAYRFLYLIGSRDLAPDQNTFRALFSNNFMIAGLFITVVNALINITRAINASLGPGNLWKLVTGKYHKPKEEEYIFMFLDLTSSTTAAEQMGHIKYSKMIQDCYYDLTTPIIQNKGNIYQYVGDEAVVFWRPDRGQENWQCIKLFYDFERILENRKSYYQENYNWYPRFKASLHVGPTIVTQVGAVKREIAYHGDTLNTAARILSRCNEKGASLLISEPIRKLLFGTLEKSDIYEVRSEGVEILKGKESEVSIYSVRLPSQGS